MKTLSPCGADRLPQRAHGTQKIMPENCAATRICWKEWRKIESVLARHKTKEPRNRGSFDVDRAGA
jgi:hypothetical protein